MIVIKQVLLLTCTRKEQFHQMDTNGKKQTRNFIWFSRTNDNNNNNTRKVRVTNWACYIKHNGLARDFQHSDALCKYSNKHSNLLRVRLPSLSLSPSCVCVCVRFYRTDLFARLDLCSEQPAELVCVPDHDDDTTPRRRRKLYNGQSSRSR